MGKISDGKGNSATLKQARAAHSEGDIDRAFALYRKAVREALDDHRPRRRFVRFLEALYEENSDVLADLLPTFDSFVRVAHIRLSRGELEGAANILRRTSEIDPRINMKLEQHALQRDTGGAVRNQRPAPWPGRTSAFEDFEGAIRKFVLAEVRREPLLSRSSRVVTMGSCFAGHVATGLKNRGVDVYYRRIDERLNTTYANRHLVDWIIDGPSNDYTRRLHDVYGDERVGFEKALSACDVFIYSLGVAPDFFDDDNHHVMSLGGVTETARLPQFYLSRTTSVEENVANMAHILGRLRALNEKVKVILTVSPVPLNATFERKSAVLADCVSKSVMRLTAEELVGEDRSMQYWPAFEIVRWLGAYVPQDSLPAFGEKDGRSIHVSPWLRDMIIRLFVEYFSDGSLAEKTPEHAQAAGPTDMEIVAQ